ncbi:MAG: hypothetical protein SGPRY_009017, partial [Prymnesium sp.]
MLTEKLRIAPFEERHDEQLLDVHQLTRTASEALVLCMPPSLSQLSPRELRTLRQILTSLLGEEADPHAFYKLLQLEGYDDAGRQALQPYLHYRLLLLIQKRPADFSSARDFHAWGERQVALLFNGLLGSGGELSKHSELSRAPIGGSHPLLSSGLDDDSKFSPLLVRGDSLPLMPAPSGRQEGSTIESNSPMSTGEVTPARSSPSREGGVGEGGGGEGEREDGWEGAREREGEGWGRREREGEGGRERESESEKEREVLVERRIERAKEKEWARDYTTAVRELHACVWDLYATLDDSLAAAALRHQIRIPHPLSGRLYAVMLLSTFAADGIPLPTTECVVQLLGRVRESFGLSVE